MHQSTGKHNIFDTSYNVAKWLKRVTTQYNMNIDWNQLYVAIYVVPIEAMVTVQWPLTLSQKYKWYGNIVPSKRKATKILMW